jgi:hypothetical protein
MACLSLPGNGMELTRVAKVDPDLPREGLLLGPAIRSPLIPTVNTNALTVTAVDNLLGAQTDRRTRAARTCRCRRPRWSPRQSLRCL